MSNPLRKGSTKRATSVSDKRIPNKVHFDYQNNRIQTHPNDSCEEESFDAQNRVVNTEPSFRANDLLDRDASLYAEIERLCDFNYKLNQDNKALTLKAASNNHLHKKVTELEALNAQLLQDLARKDDLLLCKEREIVNLNQDNSRKRQVQSTYVDLLAQNRTLSEEISSLKNELDIKSHMKNTADSSPRKFNLKLEQFNLQIESLREDLIAKNMEIEELKDRLKSQQHNYRSSFSPSPIKRSSVFDEDDKRQLISDLREELHMAQRELDLATKRSESLQTDLLSKEHLISALTQDLEEVRRKHEHKHFLEEKEMELVIKKRINESIKKMLQEKVQYEEEINYLKEKAQNLEREVANLKVDADFEWQKLYTEKTELKHRHTDSHLQKKDQELKLLEERCQNLENSLQRTEDALFEKEKELERTLQSLKEKDNSKRLLEENQRLKREIEDLEAKLADHNQQIEIVTQDCQKLASLYTELEERLQSERHEKEQFAGKYADLSKELSDSRTRQLSSLKDREKFTQQRKRLEDEGVHLSTLNDQLNNEVAELNKLLFQKERETLQHFENNENLKRENNKLKNILRQEIIQKDNTTYSIKKSFHDTEKELSKYKTEVKRLNLSLEESNIDLGVKVDRSEL